MKIREEIKLASLEVFGLLHLAQNENSAVNVKVKSFSEQISIYLDSALLLNKSLAKQGIKFTLLTNDAKTLIDLLPFDSLPINIEELDMKLSVPAGTKFYSAHYKLEVFKYIGNWKGSYGIFCDLDMVCLGPLPKVFENLKKLEAPLIYDITDQIIPADGHDFMIEIFERILKSPSEGRWMGGEFIAGTPEFFESLTEQINSVLPNYFELISNGKWRTSGNDEIFTTAAVEILQQSGKHVSDAGLLNIVGRYWSSGTGYVQKPFNHFENVFLLHLPADKYFLQKQNQVTEIFEPRIFIENYKRYLFAKKIKSIPRAVLYLLFRIKSRIVILRSIKLAARTVEDFK
jgi:hypothetical protein